MGTNRLAPKFVERDFRSLFGYWKRIAREARYDQHEMARLSGISVRHLERCLKRDISRSPEEWLNDLRMQDAPLLLSRNPVIKAAASELGFKQTSHFCRKFKEAHGLTPTEFIRRQLCTLSLSDNVSRSGISNVAVG